jgi:hypothetical protein
MFDKIDNMKDAIGLAKTLIPSFEKVVGTLENAYHDSGLKEELETTGQTSFQFRCSAYRVSVIIEAETTPAEYEAELLP